MKIPTVSDYVLPAILNTDDAAAALNRKPQTLRRWACQENGPLRPVRVHRRLGWLASDIEKLLRGEVAE